MGRLRTLVAVGWRVYSGWKIAMVLPSGSLNQAERPMPGVVTTWSTVLKFRVVLLELDASAHEFSDVFGDVGRTRSGLGCGRPVACGRP